MNVDVSEFQWRNIEVYLLIKNSMRAKDKKLKYFRELNNVMLMISKYF